MGLTGNLVLRSILGTARDVPSPLPPVRILGACGILADGIGILDPLRGIPFMSSLAKVGVALLILALTAVGESSLEQLVRQQDWEAALQVADELISADSADANDYYLAGVARWQTGDKVRSIQAFRSAQRLGLDTAYLHKALGLAYFDVNQFRLFKQQMDKAIAIDASDVQALFHLGRYQELVRNDFESALGFFEEVLRRNPEHAESRYFLGYCLENLHRTQEAMAAYREAAAMDWTEAFHGLVRLVEDSDPEAALAWARKAVESEPERAEGRFLVARILWKMKQYSAALQAVEHAIKLAPDHVEAHFLLHRIHRQLGNSAEAGRALATFKRLRAAYGDF